MSRYDYPDDEFDADDDGPVPVGVHRAQIPAWRSWIPLLAILIIVPLLAWGAVGLLGRHADGSSGASTATAAVPADDSADDAAQGGGEEQATAEPTAQPTEEPTGNADFTTGITVHNGTNTTGLATRTGDKLSNAGFTSVTVSQGVYSATEPANTTVYYASADQAATAQAVVDALGSGELVESAAEAQSNPIVVVLRSDYQE